MEFPKFVDVVEEGPREGFQMETEIFPIEERAALVNRLADTGLSKIQVGAFVGSRVPQMADTAQLFDLIRKREGTRYTALWLNERGFKRAWATPKVDLDGKLMFYSSDAFCRLNNGCGMAEMQERQRDWLALYDDANLPLETAYIMTSFGCNIQGNVPVEDVLAPILFVRDICESEGRETPKIVLGDTVGWANPETIKERVAAVRQTWPGVRVGLHLHDTRGLGIANVYAALQIVVDLFEGSVGGLGGCPFAGIEDAKGAGNVATEEVVFLCHSLGIETGIDLDALVDAALMAERIVGRRLGGRVMHAGIRNN